MIYEPVLQEFSFCGFERIEDLTQFKRSCDVILANRSTEELSDVAQKVYTRDVFHRD